MNYFEVKNLKKIWNNHTKHKVVAVEDISFSLNKGDFLVIVGSNASGKSTLVNMISGNTFPSSGEVFLDGKNITNENEYDRSLQIAKVKQDPNHSLVSGLSVVENFALALKRGLSNLIWVLKKEFIVMFLFFLVDRDKLWLSFVLL